ncbi:MAG: helix-turn-helix transcriptional regulator [Bdellovibrionales bacterium]|nr:helix-turn-helix transcriptional regulator [Bdellovibrionales bacterium]
MKRGRPKGRSRDSRSFGPLGDLIRKSRLEKQLGLLDVAQACDCSVQFISNIEHGRAPLPWDKVSGLAQFLGLTVEEVQAANLAVRSDFKSFALAGKTGKKSGKRLAAPSVLLGASDAAQAFAATASDAQLRSLIAAYQSATLANRKKFVKAALKMLEN